MDYGGSEVSVRFVCRTDSRIVLDDFILFCVGDVGCTIVPLLFDFDRLLISDLSVPDVVNASKKRIKLDGYCCSVFRYVLELSHVYRGLVFNNFSVCCPSNSAMVVRVRLTVPSRHVFDYKWNYMLSESCRERGELEATMSWLSTLGGAFSSLGDQIHHWAVAAAKISAHQFCLALRLGDPLTVVRCKLYFSISLIQRQKFHLASRIIKSQYKYIHTFHEVDRRLVSMCLGIWSKLKYERGLLKSRGVS